MTDFRETLKKLVGKQVRIGFYTDGSDDKHSNVYWGEGVIKSLNDHTLIFHHSKDTDYPFKHLNLEAIMIFEVVAKEQIE